METMADAHRVEKPWGHEIIWAHTNQYVGKVLHILKGHRLSLQYHKQKDETIYVLSGRLSFTVGCAEDDLRVIVMEPGTRYHIQPGLIHRMKPSKRQISLKSLLRNSMMLSGFETITVGSYTATAYTRLP